jgi:hypothetical protein
VISLPSECEGLKSVREVLLSELNELDKDGFISALGNVVE